MKPSNKYNSSLIIQLIILVIIAIIGILYILEEAPVASLNLNDKQHMVTPFGSSSSGDSLFLPKSDDDGDGDDVSLSGKKGRYDEALIGK